MQTLLFSQHIERSIVAMMLSLSLQIRLTVLLKNMSSMRLGFLDPVLSIHVFFKQRCRLMLQHSMRAAAPYRRHASGCDIKPKCRHNG